MKLLYLADLRSYEETGRGLVNLPWIWHHFGPFCKVVYEVASDMEVTDEMTVDVSHNYFGAPEYRLRPGPAAGLYTALTSEEQALLVNVVHEFGRIPAAQLANYTYYTAPMATVDERGESLDFSAYDDPVRERPPRFAPSPDLPTHPRLKTD